jgi:hypothetical protein
MRPPFRRLDAAPALPRGCTLALLFLALAAAQARGQTPAEPTQAVQAAAVQSGDWSASQTWTCTGAGTTSACVPNFAISANSTALLFSVDIGGHSVSLDTNPGSNPVSVQGVTIGSGGTLTVSNGMSLGLGGGLRLAGQYAPYPEDTGGFTNNGTLNVAGPGSQVGFPVGGSISNAGYVDVYDGGLVNDGALSQVAGIWEISSGGTLITTATQGITQIGDGAADAGIVLNGPASQIEVLYNGALLPGSNTGLANLQNIAANGALVLVSGASATTGALTNSGNGNDCCAFFGAGSGITLANGGSLTVEGTLQNSGYIAVYGDSGPGGALAVHGDLVNAGTLNVGYFSQTSVSAVTVAGSISNSSGTVYLTGGTAPGSGSVLNAAGPAPSAITGTWGLTGNVGGAVADFGSGGITSIGDGTTATNVSLNGTNAFIESGGAAGNTGLARLGTIAGNATLYLLGGASVTTGSAINVSSGGTLSIGGGTFSAAGASMNNSGNIYLYNGGSGLSSTLLVAGGFTNSGLLSVADSAMTAPSAVTIGGSLTNDAAGRIYVNGGTDAGAPASLNVTGDFGNAGLLNIGATTMGSPATVEVGGAFANTGGLYLIGGSSTSAQAELRVSGPPPATITGTWNLTGNAGGALVDFGSGGITQIGDGTAATTLWLSGSNAQVDVVGGSGPNSALSGLSTIAANGALELWAGATVGAAGPLTNNGHIYVSSTALPSFLGVGGEMTNNGLVVLGYPQAVSGSTIAVAGSLLNNGSVLVDPMYQGGDAAPGGDTFTVGGPLAQGSGASIAIGNAGLKPGLAAVMTVAGLAGTNGQPSSTWSGGLDITSGQGTAALVTGGAAISTVAPASGITIDGAQAFIELRAGDDANSALAGLAANNGTLSIEDGATVATSGGLGNAGYIGVGDQSATGGSTLAIGGALDDGGAATLVIGDAPSPSKASVTVAGDMITSGQVSIAPDGSLTVTGAYTQNGGATGVDGTLTARGGVSIGSGSLLYGSGSVDGNVVNGGTLAPGDPVTLTVNGDYTQTGAGQLIIDLLSATDFTRLNILGNAYLGGALEFDLLDGYAPLAGTDFNFLDVGGAVSGDFTSVAFSGGNCAGCEFDLGTLSLDTPAPTSTPEPSGALLLLAGLLCLALAQRSGWLAEAVPAREVPK